MELIPGLTDDLARECLIRVPFRSYASLLSVCKAWNRELRNPDFHRYRKLAGLTRPVFVITQQDPDTSTQWIVLFDPEAGLWTQLPPRPRLPSESGPDVVGVGLNKILTISSGWEPSLRGLRYFNMVHVFDFLTGQWRRAADMPGPGRYSFGLACDPTRGKVLVAGGQCSKSGAMQSVLMYEVETDEWAQLGCMEKERCGCNAVFHGGKFHVIGGYGSDMVYKILTSAESLDPETWQWGPVEEGFLEAGWSWTSACCRVMENGEGDLYKLGRNVEVRRGGRNEWQAVTGIPNELLFIEGMVTWKDKMVVTGVQLHQNGPFYTYLLDLKSLEWSKLDLPEEYSTRVLEKGCGMDL